MKKVTVNGKKVRVRDSKRKNKQKVAIFPSGEKVHFGDPKMPEFPGTDRGNNYCARSSGIKGKNNPKSANFWSRKYLWNCKGKKSLKQRTI